MGENILWYLAGILTVPLSIAAYSLIVWTFGKTSGTGTCVIECRGGQREMEIGDHFNVTVWLDRVRHRLFWSSRKSHKVAVTKYWQDIYDNGGQTRTDVGVIFQDEDSIRF